MAGFSTKFAQFKSSERCKKDEGREELEGERKRVKEGGGMKEGRVEEMEGLEEE